MIIQTSFGALPQIDRSQVDPVDTPLDDFIAAASPVPLGEPQASPLHPTGIEPIELSPARPPRRLSDEEDEDEDGNIADDDDDGDDEEEEDEDEDDDSDEDEDEDSDDDEDEDEDDDDEDEDEDKDEDEDDDEE